MIKDILVNGNGGWVGAVARLGLPVVLALALTSFLIFKVDAALGSVVEITSTNGAKMDAANVRMSAYAVEQENNQRILRNIALQTCLNVAKTEVASQACLRAAEK
jgi:hypothetical protein